VAEYDRGGYDAVVESLLENVDITLGLDASGREDTTHGLLGCCHGS
jgi:hypothetical protein